MNPPAKRETNETAEIIYCREDSCSEVNRRSSEKTRLLATAMAKMAIIP
jgi:hypothetical protein